MKLIRGKTRKDFDNNIKVMIRSGHDTRRAVGAAYGELFNAIDRDERERARNRRK